MCAVLDVVAAGIVLWRPGRRKEVLRRSYG
jgi:hypothetical protein